MKTRISRSPSYLVRNPFSFCFRMNVPKDLQVYVGRKELRYFLNTGYLSHAKHNDVLHSLSNLFLIYGIPEDIRSDNGPEFTAKAVRRWLGRIGVKTTFI